MTDTARPIMYIMGKCPVCLEMKADWTAEGRDFEIRRSDNDDTNLNEALQYGDHAPIVVYPDGRVEKGYKGRSG